MDDTRRFLLAEDNSNDVELTLAALRQQKHSHEIIVVRDGIEALDYLYARGRYAGRASGSPAACILDIKMPKVGGIEVLRAIKSDRALRNIPVIMLTSSREEADLIKSYELGANAYVVKPVNYTQFSSTVQALGSFWMSYNEPPPAGAI